MMEDKVNTENFRVYLRAFELEDYKTTIKWRKDDEIWDMAGSTKYIVSEEYEKKWIHDAIWDKNKIWLGVCLKETDELIGFCGVKDIDWINRSAMISYLIGEKKYWGKGYATEANSLLIDFCFNERGLNRIWTTVVETNKASKKVLEKLGFSLEGTVKSAYFRHGNYVNAYQMSLIRSEVEELKKSE